MADDITRRLIDAAERLMRAGRKAETLTSREIAAEAGVSVGLINYYFGSKNELIGKAAERLFADFNPRWERVTASAKEASEAALKTGADRREATIAALRAGKAELKEILKGLADATVLAGAGNDFGLRRDLMEGEMTQTKFVVPVLRSILPPSTDERELRWAAFFIVAPLQLVFLRNDFLSKWTGTNLDDKKDRDSVFDFLIDRILEPFAGTTGTSSEHIR
ncbi:MAG: helix-turn-helix domain-containing protein [Treponemataceae bacterium]